MFEFFRKKTADIPEVKCSAVIAAAGQGERMGAGINKMFMTMLDKPLIYYTLNTFEQCDSVDEIVIVTREEDIIPMRDIAENFGIYKVSKIVAGGDTRQQSVRRGIEEVNESAEIILIHDGARPFVTNDELESLIDETYVTGACALGTKVKDTIKRVGGENIITETPERDNLRAVATPQAFNAAMIKEAHRRAEEDGFCGTDDCALAERLGVKVKIIECSYNNIKITTPEDVYVGEKILYENRQRV